MSPIQQMLLGVGAVATKTYVDDVFSTYVYRGTGSNKTITNNIDLSGKGGMVWIKRRSLQGDHQLYDTVRGATKYIVPNSTMAQQTDTSTLTSFNNDGFSVGTDGANNGNNVDISSWSFAKAPGFCDVVTYTGNGTAGKTVSHSLGCKPGFMIIKQLDGTGNFSCYHRNLQPSGAHYIPLNTGGSPVDATDIFNDTAPTSSVFSVGTSGYSNQNGSSYVAYVFAGGESTAANARSVEFEPNTNAGTGDYLLTSSSSDYTMGTGDFTVEGWFKTESYDKTFLQITDSSSGFSTSAANITLWVSSAGHYTFHAGNGEKSTTVKATKNQWEHLAYVRHNGTTSLYVNGTFIGSKADTHNYNGTYVNVGAGYAASFAYDGKISNFRVVKGTAVYTSSFRPPTEPLTSISGTGLLCCNNSSVTGTTTGSVSSNGTPTASTDHPFDDPAGFKFGESGSENVIKCGSYEGNGSTSSPPIINLGFEPQWLMVRRSDGGGRWWMFDNLRGIPTGGNSVMLKADSSDAEVSDAWMELTSTGFIPQHDSSDWYSINKSGNSYIYICIRRPDGYVGKPVELGTSVFAMSTIQSSDPRFVSNFPVDFLTLKLPASVQGWYASARLIQGKNVMLNETSAESNNTTAKFDFSNGAYITETAAYQAWMWKRHAGFDVVTFKGDGVAGRQVPHSLGKVPEMMWVKNRDAVKSWFIYNKFLNGGNQPEGYYVRLNTQDQEGASSNIWNSTAPTSTHFTLGLSSHVNGSGNEMIAMLFSSVDGISKFGSYNGSYSSQTITTGFQPRFVWIRRVNQGISPFVVLDTTRGWGSGNDNYLDMSSTAAQVSADMGAPTSTGFTLPGNVTSVNTGALSSKYMYWAHA